ncbi:hypothetical protein BGZ47_000404 [Haplosporangium gracile]|nr:hypothetical protein BGZ47_000404 [Haplosporangium gracile]
MIDKLMQLIDGQNVLFKNQMDQVTAQMTSHLFRLTFQLNAQGSQLNTQLYAQGSQLTQLKIHTSHLNIETGHPERVAQINLYDGEHKLGIFTFAHRSSFIFLSQPIEPLGLDTVQG